MYKYILIEYFLDTLFPIEIKEKILNYLLPQKNYYLNYILKPKMNYYNRYFSTNTMDWSELYITQYYNELIIQFCENCSHIIYIKYKKKSYYKKCCNCYN